MSPSLLPDLIHRAPTRAAILLVDLQVDFLDERGRLPVDRGSVTGLLSCVEAVIAEAREAGVPIAHITNAFPRRSPLNIFRKFAAIEGAPGAEIDARIPRLEVEPTFDKSRASAFTNPDLEAWLRAQEIERVVILGVFAEHCVRRTVEGARALGFEVFVPRAGVASSGPRGVARGLRAMTRAGAEIV